MNEMISNIHWEVILNNKIVDEQRYTFTHKVNLFADQLIPRCKVNSNPNRKLKKLWMNTEALTKVKKKHGLWKIYMLSQKKEDYQKYCIARNQAKYATIELIEKFEMDLAGDINEQPPKHF